MSDILSPQGFEPNEAIQDTDVQEVYQPTSGGIRRNKQATLATLKAFFRKLTTFTPNSIVEADGTGDLRTTSIATSALSQSITDTNANTNEIDDKLNQGVKTTDSPVFAGATVAGHNVDSELSVLNSRVNQGVKTTDNPTFSNAQIGGRNINTSLDAIETVLNQDLTTTSAPTFADVILTGLGAIKSMITTLNSRVNQGVKSTDSPLFEDVNITGLSGSVEANIETNKNDINTLETKTPQSYKTTDDVMFNTVNTGQGANELYDMNQNVKTTDTPTFADVILTGLGNIKAIIQSLVDKTPQSYKTTDDVEFNKVNIEEGQIDFNPSVSTGNQRSTRLVSISWDSTRTEGTVFDSLGGVSVGYSTSVVGIHGSTAILEVEKTSSTTIDFIGRNGAVVKTITRFDNTHMGFVGAVMVVNVS